MSFEKACQDEVVELHVFFQQWFRGELPDTDAGFVRFPAVLLPDFEIVTPAGQAVRRAECLQAVRQGYGSDPLMMIEIRNYQHRMTYGDVAVVGYEEWQVHGGVERAWRSTAVLIAKASVPGGIGWAQVHETFLPAKGSLPGKDGEA